MNTEIDRLKVIVFPDGPPRYREYRPVSRFESQDVGNDAIRGQRTKVRQARPRFLLPGGLAGVVGRTAAGAQHGSGSFADAFKLRFVRPSSERSDDCQTPRRASLAFAGT